LRPTDPQLSTVNFNDFQAQESTGIQALTIVMPPSPFKSDAQENSDVEHPQEHLQQPVAADLQPELTIEPEAEEPPSASEQQGAEVPGPSIAIGYYTSEPTTTSATDTMSQR
jgi:hypothetical protein